MSEMKQPPPDPGAPSPYPTQQPPPPGQPPAYPTAQPGTYPTAQPGTYPTAQPGTYPTVQPGTQPAPQPGVYPAPPPGQPGVYAPQQPGYAQPPPGTFVSQGPGQPPAPPGATVFVSQPGAVVVAADHPSRSGQPVRMTCPTCQQNIQTTIEYEVGLFSWLIVGAVCLFGFAIPLVWLGCCFIPLCIKDCKDVKHTCPNCNTHLGTYQRAK